MASPSAKTLINALGGRPEVEAGADWNTVLALALHHRLAGLVWSLRPWSRPMTDEVAQSAEGAHRMQAASASVLVEEVNRVRAVLADENICIGLIKGMALISAGLYEPGARAVDDADVVIPPFVAKRAISALMAAGYVPWADDVLGTAEWCDAATFYLSPGHQLLNLSIDLHWGTSYGSLRYGSGDAALPKDAFDPETGALATEYHLVLILEHVLKHLRYRVHLSGIGDAVRLLGGVEDWDLVERLIRESFWRRALTALLVALVRSTGAGPLPGRFAARADLGLTNRLDPARLVGRTKLGATPVGGILSRWRMVGPAGALKDVRSVLFPPAEWLAARYKSRRHSSTSLLWSRHAARLMGWSLKLAPSPLSPNQR